jgi:hypothetical protein
MNKHDTTTAALRIRTELGLGDFPTTVGAALWGRARNQDIDFCSAVNFDTNCVAVWRSNGAEVYGKDNLPVFDSCAHGFPGAATACAVAALAFDPPRMDHVTCAKC